MNGVVSVAINDLKVLRMFEQQFNSRRSSYVCLRCGCMVWDLYKHYDWHASVDSVATTTTAKVKK